MQYEHNTFVFLDMHLFENICQIQLYLGQRNVIYCSMTLVSAVLYIYLHMCHLLCNRLFFESLPQEAATNNLCNGYKKWKEQVTMHFYCTASGNGKLLKLVVSILKMSCLNSLTPHPFPHPLPFFVTVRMTHNLFKEWLLNTEKKMNSLKNWSYTYSLITLFL